MSAEWHPGSSCSPTRSIRRCIGHQSRSPTNPTYIDRDRDGDRDHDHNRDRDRDRARRSRSSSCSTRPWWPRWRRSEASGTRYARPSSMVIVATTPAASAAAAAVAAAAVAAAAAPTAAAAAAAASCATLSSYLLALIRKMVKNSPFDHLPGVPAGGPVQPRHRQGRLHPRLRHRAQAPGRAGGSRTMEKYRDSGCSGRLADHGETRMREVDAAGGYRRRWGYKEDDSGGQLEQSFANIVQSIPLASRPPLLA